MAQFMLAFALLEARADPRPRLRFCAPKPMRLTTASATGSPTMTLKPVLLAALPALCLAAAPAHALPSSVEALTDLRFDILVTRSEERRVGNECVRTGRSQWAPVL